MKLGKLLLIPLLAVACSDKDEAESETMVGQPTSGAEGPETGADDASGPNTTGVTSLETSTSNGDAAEGTETAGNDDQADTSADTEVGGDEVPPIGAEAILPWLEAERYAHWAAESEVHPSAGPHGAVRTFVNDTLLASMAQSATQHPADSAAVKELYSGGERNGWAVMVRLDDGPGDQAWYWYEIIGASVIADGVNVGLCANCHANGDDYVRTPYPLQ